MSKKKIDSCCGHGTRIVNRANIMPSGKKVYHAIRICIKCKKQVHFFKMKDGE